MEKINDRKNCVIWSHDPGGNVFLKDGVIYRRINNIYQRHYDHLMSSGLYERLAGAGLLIPHKEVGLEGENSQGLYKIIQPERLPFISYPYEWCFSQLKDAALATLEIQKAALEHGMSLKDGSAFNIQFWRGKPVLIDTLSFERYIPGEPWVAYRNFCQHFVAPLALMSYKDARLVVLFRTYHDGIPLDLAGALLPLRARVNPFLFSHLHLHAWMQRFLGEKAIKKNKFVMSRFALRALIDNLESSIKRMKLKGAADKGPDYCGAASYLPEAMRHKKQVVSEFLDKITPKTLWDFGANTGVFSRLAVEKGISVVSFDNDHAAVEESYRSCVNNREAGLIPLYVDIVNSSPLLGWAAEERMYFKERGPADAAFALALIHHLAIARTIPLDVIADFFANICHSLIIEFVPKHDPRAQRMLKTREDIFRDYTQEGFEKAFKRFFNVISVVKIKDSERSLYLMQRENS